VKGRGVIVARAWEGEEDMLMGREWEGRGDGRCCWVGSWLLLLMMMMVMFWDGTGRFIGIGYAIYGNLDVARGTKISIGWRVLPKAARVKEILEFPQREFSSRHCRTSWPSFRL